MIRFSLRLPDDVHDRIAAQAAKDRRSINSEILHLLETALDALDAADAGSPSGDPATPAPLRGGPDSSPA